VRAQAKRYGILLCGDEPFIVSADSSDGWCNPTALRRDARLGVPPDDFSADGQDWGLPWFDFDALAKTGDAWLKLRARYAASLYDVRRVDHAIGYFRQYIRDAATPKGRFVPEAEAAWPPLGQKNFALLSEGASIIAEDLGVIPPWARSTLQALGLPGYCVMRWEREDGVYKNPHAYPPISLATTGTHDTEPLRAWWEGCESWEREALCRAWPECQRFQPPGPAFTRDVHEALVAAALNSSSQLCVLPWQDVFAELGRVNAPGSMGPHNWSYRIAHDVEVLLTREDTVAAADWLARLTEAGTRA
jgi:4-alpha-glucanotransferase